MTITELAKKVKSLKSALIFCHIRPDGDTLSCAFALKKILAKLDIKSEVVCGDNVPDKYAECGYFGTTYKEPPSGKFDCCIAVDCATPDLMGYPYDYFAKSYDNICIDHHYTNARYADNLYLNCVAACSMNIYYLAKELGVEIDKDLANTLLIGILTDTGSFAHTNTDAECLSVATELTRLGGELPILNRRIFCSKTKNEINFQTEIVSKMKFFHDDRLAIMVITRDVMKKYGVDRSATEAFIDLPLSIKSVEAVVSILESDDKRYKLSFRSKNINVAEIARSYGGGGHPQASGAMLSGYLEDVIDKLVFTIGNYL